MTYCLAKIAYEAWRRSLGNAPFNEKFQQLQGLPSFEDLDEVFQEAWENVANAIVKAGHKKL